MTIKFIILHWTGGNYKPNSADLNSYQLLIDNEGKTYNGKPAGKTSSTGGMNSITYNISCCGGLDRTPITKVQIEKLFKTAAEKCKQFGITPAECYTHYEIGEMTRNYIDYKYNGVKLFDINKRKITGLITDILPYNSYLPQNVGKVDLTKNPYSNMTPTGIRNKIRWYFNK